MDFSIAWSDLPTYRLILQASILLIVAGLYIWLSIYDFKYKEVALWQIILTGGLSFGLTYMLPIIFKRKCLWFLGIIFIIWPILLYLNGKFNKQTIIGQADIDLFSINILMSIGMLRWVYVGSPKEVAIINILYVSQIILGSIVIGLILCIIVWFTVALIQSIKTKRKIKDILLSEHQYVPAIISMLPFALMNTYLIMAAL